MRTHIEDRYDDDDDDDDDDDYESRYQSETEMVPKGRRFKSLARIPLDPAVPVHSKCFV